MQNICDDISTNFDNFDTEISTEDDDTRDFTSVNSDKNDNSSANQCITKDVDSLDTNNLNVWFSRCHINCHICQMVLPLEIWGHHVQADHCMSVTMYKESMGTLQTKNISNAPMLYVEV